MKYTASKLRGANYSKFLLMFIVIVAGCDPVKEKENRDEKQWYKGNLHTHSYWSDGDEFPEMIMDWYKSNDYQFVALSDHNILAEGEKWVVLSKDSIYQSAFDKYLDQFGPEWVEYTKEAGQIQVKLKTFEEYRTRFEENGKFLIIQSEEITDSFEGRPLHMNATNIQELIEPQGGISVIDVLQNNIDAVLLQRDQSGVPILPHINHPNFGYAIGLTDMIAIRGERFFEVYNGHPAVHNSGDSTHISTEEMWDLINISYLRDGKPLMYGLATDDSHHYHTKGSKWSNAGRGWIMVQADSLDPTSLIEAMESGNFYSTTGVTLNKVKFDGKKLSIDVNPEAGVDYVISFIGCRKGQSEPVEFEAIEGPSGSFELTEDILFVRCKITSTKFQDNPIENLVYEMAWTQPVLSM